MRGLTELAGVLVATVIGGVRQNRNFSMEGLDSGSFKRRLHLTLWDDGGYSTDHYTSTPHHLFDDYVGHLCYQEGNSLLVSIWGDELTSFDWSLEPRLSVTRWTTRVCFKTCRRRAQR